MILAARGGSNYAYGAFNGVFDSYGPFLSPVSSDSNDSVVGLTAVAAAIRLVSEIIASGVFRVYTGPSIERQPLFDHPAAQLFQDAAPGYCTSVDLWRDVITQVELTGNALIWKGFAAGRKLVELYPFPTETARIFVDEDSGQKRVEVRVDGELKDVTKNVIHVRGWSPLVSVAGASTLELHRRAFKTATSLELFRGRYFDTDATPNLVLTHPGNPNPTQRQELRDSWNQRHSIAGDAEKVAVLWSGMDVKQLTSTLRDSQVSELTNADALQIARAFRIYPPGLLAAGPDTQLPPVENVTDLFARFSLLHRYRAVERALSSDPDLFPVTSGKASERPYAKLDLTGFLGGDIKTITQMVHAFKQDGMISANEGRGYVGLPKSDDPNADTLQVVPVGGTPFGRVPPGEETPDPTIPPDEPAEDEDEDTTP